MLKVYMGINIFRPQTPSPSFESVGFVCNCTHETVYIVGEPLSCPVHMKDELGGTFCQS